MERRRDDLGRYEEQVPESPSMEAQAQRIRNANLARSIAAEQTLSGTTTAVTASRFNPERLQKVFTRDQTGRLTVRWDRVQEGDGSPFRSR